MRACGIRRMCAALIALSGLLLLSSPALAQVTAGSTLTQGSNPSATVTRLAVYYRSAQAALGKAGRVPDTDTPVPVLTPASGDSSRIPGALASAFAHGVIVDLPQAMTMPQALAFAARYDRDPDVHAIVPDLPIGLHTLAVNDTYRGLMWNLWSNPGAPPVAGSSRTEPVWSQYRGSGVTVAVLDTGRVQHDDLVGVWTGGFDMVSNLTAAQDGSGRDNDPDAVVQCASTGAATTHGLMVASVIAARRDNARGIVGVAPDAQIMPIRVLSGCGLGSALDLLDGMRWAVGLPVAGLPVNPAPARILNLSLGSTGANDACSPSIQAIIDEVLATGAVIVVATGNDGLDRISVPASCAGVIAVSASTRDGGRASYANAGYGTTLSAPGGGCAAGVVNCAQDNFLLVATKSASVSQPVDYAYTAGTSFATPHVAGAAALLMQRDASLGADGVRSRLVNSARAFAPGLCDHSLCGVGLLDVEQAMANSGFSLALTTSASSIRDGSSVTLTAQVAGSTLAMSYVWQQLSGPPVSLAIQDGGRIARFVAPPVNGVISFKVIATDASNHSQMATVSTHVSLAPSLASIDPIDVLVGDIVNQSLLLSDGRLPEAVTIDPQSEANGMQVLGNRLVWQPARTGSYPVVITPFDAIGAGVSTSLTIVVAAQMLTSTTLEGPSAADPSTPTPAQSEPAVGGGGAVGWHGAALLMLVGLARWPRRTRLSPSFDQGMPGAAACVTMASLWVWLLGVQAPVHAWLVRQSNPFWLWGASFVHIDASHLLVNLAGAVVLQILLGSLIPLTAWLFAFLIAAPVAHAVAINAGNYSWVAGLSTGLHAVLAFTAMVLLADGRRRCDHRESVFRDPQSAFGLMLMAGLALKIGLDAVWAAEWPDAHAHVAASLHALAAGVAAAAGTFWQLSLGRAGRA